MGNQNKGYITVATNSTAFGRILPVGQRVLEEDLNEEFILTQSATDTDTLDSVTKTRVPNVQGEGGWLSGGDVSRNAGDNKTFDVTAGTGEVMDYTFNPPKLVPVVFGAFTAEALPDITKGFTLIFIDKVGAIVKISGALEPESFKRTHITLAGVGHLSGVQIDTVSKIRIPSLDYSKGLGDYVDNAPNLNFGNSFVTNGANLLINKEIGVTISSFSNQTADAQNPSTIANAAVSPISFSPSYRDGVGGFTLDPQISPIDPDVYDDGSGVLATLGNNNVAIHLLCYSSETDAAVISIGQKEYANLTAALDDVPYQVLELNPVLVQTTCISILIVKKGTTNLQIDTDARLFPNRFKFF